MTHSLSAFLLHWALTTLSLWVASRVFVGLRFNQTSDLVVSGLLLGLVNVVVKPVLVMLTLPFTVVTFGLFLLVINALMILLVSALVRGFTVSSFGTALWASVLISVLRIVLNTLLASGPDAGPSPLELPSGTWT